MFFFSIVCLFVSVLFFNKLTNINTSKRTLDDFWFKKEQNAVQNTIKSKLIIEIHLFISLLTIVSVNL